MFGSIYFGQSPFAGIPLWGPSIVVPPVIHGGGGSSRFRVELDRDRQFHVKRLEEERQLELEADEEDIIAIVSLWLNLH